jgi:hypothetical protein
MMGNKYMIKIVDSSGQVSFLAIFFLGWNTF